MMDAPSNEDNAEDKVSLSDIEKYDRVNESETISDEGTSVDADEGTSVDANLPINPTPDDIAQSTEAQEEIAQENSSNQSWAAGGGAEDAGSEEDTEDASGHEVGEQEDEEESQGATARPRRRFRLTRFLLQHDMHSSEGSRSDTDSTDSDIFPGHNNYDVTDLTGTDSSDEDNPAPPPAEPAPNLPAVPKDRTNILGSLQRRETGLGKRWPVEFRYETTGSVSLVRRLKKIASLKHHQGCVNALHFNQQGTLLASGSDDLEVVVWNWAVESPFYTFKSGHKSNVFQCKFMPYSGDSYMITCARDGQVRLAELSSTGQCRATKKLIQHRGAAHKVHWRLRMDDDFTLFYFFTDTLFVCLALMEDSSHLFYSCGEDGIVCQYDLREDRDRKLVEVKANSYGNRVPLYSIHANPNSSYEFCVSGRDQYVRVYDARKLLMGDGDHPVRRFFPENLSSRGNKLSVTCAVYNYDGSEILASYNDEDIYLFNNRGESNDAIHSYQGHRNNATVKGVNFYGLQSEFVVSGSDCGHVYLWEKKSQTIVNYFKADKGGVVNVLEPHPHGPILATSGLDDDIKIWTPVAENYTGLHGLKKRIKRNLNEREEDSAFQPRNSLDSHLIWMLMNHLHSTAVGGSDQSSNNPRAEEADSDDDEDDDDSNDEHDAPTGCSTS